MAREDTPGCLHASFVAWLLLVPACTAPEPLAPANDAPARAELAWTTLFDGTSLDGWSEVYGNQGLVDVVDGRMQIGFGSPLAGATWRGAFPASDYEVELAASRLGGTDFFLGLTFPVAESHCTLILGGWGGATVGLSCIDGRDASQNETRRTHSFDRGRSYAVRLRVERAHIRVWVDEELWIDQPIAGRTITVRADVLPSCPFGVATYATRAAIGPMRVRSLSPLWSVFL